MIITSAFFFIITKFLCLEVGCAHDDSVTDINSRFELLSPEPLVSVWRVICYILVFYFSFLAVCEIFAFFKIFFFVCYFLNSLISEQLLGWGRTD